MSDAEEQEAINTLFFKFENEYFEATHKVCRKFFLEMEKYITEVMGYRDRDPEDFELRYNDFVAWVTDVYLNPSIYGPEWRSLLGR